VVIFSAWASLLLLLLFSFSTAALAENKDITVADSNAEHTDMHRCTASGSCCDVAKCKHEVSTSNNDDDDDKGKPVQIDSFDLTRGHDANGDQKDKDKDTIKGMPAIPEMNMNFATTGNGEQSCKLCSYSSSNNNKLLMLLT
jgi:hypothetical protein